METFGELPTLVASGLVNDPERRTNHEVDVAVLGGPEGGTSRVLSLGEAKWSEVMGMGHLQRLRRVKELVTARGYDTRSTVLACYSGVGFYEDLRAAAGEPDVALVDLGRLYGGG